MARSTYDAGQKKILSWEIRLSYFLAKSAGSKEAMAWSSSVMCACVRACSHTCSPCQQQHAYALAPPWLSHFHLYKSLPVSCPVTKNLHFTKIQKGKESSGAISRCTAAPAPLLCCRRSPLVCLRCSLAGKDQLYKAVRGSMWACWLAGSLAASLRSGRGVSANFQRLLWLVYD